MEDITIVVNSCDAYSDLWYPFFELLRMQWPDCAYPIILNTESSTYEHPQRVGGGITCLQLFNPGTGIDWSTRLLRTLDYVQTNYVLMILDDEFILEPVDKEGFEKIYQIMLENKSIANILFTSLFGKGDGKPSRKYKNFNVIARMSYCQYSTNCALWQTSSLKNYLRLGESPWEFEVKSKRRRGLFDKIYMIKEGEAPIKTSIRLNGGYGVSKGKWLWKTKSLFESYGICVDMNQRGEISEEEIKMHMRQWRSKVEAEKGASLLHKIKESFWLFVDSLPEEIYESLRKVKHIGRK